MISYDRYNVIVKGFSGTPLTFSMTIFKFFLMHNMMNGVFLYLDRAVSIITMSWIWALGWSICPLVGWGAYAMDGIMGT
jgi:r-opsin